MLILPEIQAQMRAASRSDAGKQRVISALQDKWRDLAALFGRGQ
jgi:hypothetical protein